MIVERHIDVFLRIHLIKIEIIQVEQCRLELKVYENYAKQKKWLQSSFFIFSRVIFNHDLNHWSKSTQIKSKNPDFKRHPIIAGMQAAILD